MIGLDIGGTKTRGVRFEDGAPVADESVGSSNVQNVSPEEAAFNLAELFARIGGETSPRSTPEPAASTPTTTPRRSRH